MLTNACRRLSRGAARAAASPPALRDWLTGPDSRGYASAGHERTGMSATTVLCVRKGDQVVVIGDGQVTMGAEIVKPNVKKVRRIGTDVIGGFAGATADAFTLFERLETKLEEHPGQLTRACVELAKNWRMDKYLRRLDAVMVVADANTSLQITGTGDVLEPHDGVVAIGSGGPYALAAARALLDIPGMDAMAIAKKAMTIAADTCIYTNHNFTIDSLTSTTPAPKDRIAAPAPGDTQTGAAAGSEGGASQTTA